MNTALRLALALLGVPVLPTHPAEPAPSVVNVFAAASLTEAFGEIGRTFEQGHPELMVQFNFAGSQQLALQMEQGAPADVFASADQRWMDFVKNKDLIEGEAPVFARNRLVVIVPKTNPARIQRLPDLVRRGTKIVLSAEAVPVGRYSREALAKLATAEGYPAGYDRRVLANVVSQEENVKSVVAKVQLGEADAGMVYRSDVTPAVARYVRVFEIPDESNVIAEYPIAVVKSSRHPEAAQAFVDLVRSDEGQRILRQHGLLPPTAAAPAPRP
jgi:molybdate transport system substrate-binding protein